MRRRTTPRCAAQLLDNSATRTATATACASCPTASRSSLYDGQRDLGPRPLARRAVEEEHARRSASAIDFIKQKWPDLLKMGRAGKLQMWPVGWITQYARATRSCSFCTAKNIGQSNYSRFALPEYDELYRKTKKIPAGPERNALYRKMTDIVDAQNPWDLGVYQIENTLVRPWVVGYKKHVFHEHAWKYLRPRRRAAEGGEVTRRERSCQRRQATGFVADRNCSLPRDARGRRVNATAYSPVACDAARRCTLRMPILLQTFAKPRHRPRTPTHDDRELTRRVRDVSRCARHAIGRRGQRLGRRRTLAVRPESRRVWRDDPDFRFAPAALNSRARHRAREPAPVTSATLQREKNDDGPTPTCLPTEIPRALAVRRFPALWPSLTITSFGAQITNLALPLTAALLLHATPLQMGMLVALETLPFALVSLHAGVLIDRMRKLPVVIVVGPRARRGARWSCRLPRSPTAVDRGAVRRRLLLRRAERRRRRRLPGAARADGGPQAARRGERQDLARRDVGRAGRSRSRRRADPAADGAVRDPARRGRVPRLGADAAARARARRRSA